MKREGGNSAWDSQGKPRQVPCQIAQQSSCCHSQAGSSPHSKVQAEELAVNQLRHTLEVKNKKHAYSQNTGLLTLD